MKLFIYEHITSGALINQPLPESLVREGNDILLALIADFSQLTSIELIILRDARLEAITHIQNNLIHQYHIIESDLSFQKHYNNAIDIADYILPIAPETDGTLSSIQQTIRDKGKQLLGCHPESSALVSDKYHCYQILKKNKLLSPNTILASEWSLIEFHSPSGYIIKPRDGAGCIDTLFFTDQSEVSLWLENNRTDLTRLIIQPYIVGIAISLSVLYSKQDGLVLAINKQHIDNEEHVIHFSGCTINGIDESQFSLSQAMILVKKIQAAIPNLWGFVGIDLILADNEAWIIDINPRLTTSYIGLHRSLQLNPSQLLFTMMNTTLADLPKITQRHPIEILV